MPKKYKKQSGSDIFAYEKTPFKPEYNRIYIPFIAGLGVVVISLLVARLTGNVELGSKLFGLSSIIIATSGYWQIKLKVVPGMPVLRGGCAVAFGVFFLIFFTLLGLGQYFLSNNREIEFLWQEAKQNRL